MLATAEEDDIKHITNHCASTSAVKEARNERGSHDDKVGMTIILTSKHGYFDAAHDCDGNAQETAGSSFAPH